jgi:hypothetical protein
MTLHCFLPGNIDPNTPRAKKQPGRRQTLSAKKDDQQATSSHAARAGGMTTTKEGVNCGETNAERGSARTEGAVDVRRSR